MKTKFTNTNLADQYLESLSGMQEAETPPFFYTRLKARMENESKTRGWNFSLKPVWLVTMLTIFLLLNSFLLIEFLHQDNGSFSQNTSLQNFASNYGLSVSSSF